MAVQGFNRINYSSNAVTSRSTSEQFSAPAESSSTPERIESIPDHSQSRNYGIKTLELTRNLARLQEATNAQITRNNELGAQLDEINKPADISERMRQNEEQLSKLNSLMGLSQPSATSQNKRTGGLFGRGRR